MSELTVGLIGCGVMGEELAKQCVTLDGVRLVAVSDVSVDEADRVAGAFNAQAFGDHNELLSRARPDAVIVATPQFTHREMTAAAAQARAHVFCEKPMAVTLDDCDAMISACDGAGVSLMIGQVCRYHGVHRKVRDLVQSGEYGKPACMEVHRLGGPWRTTGIWHKPWRLHFKNTGGVLMEINCHEIDFMRFVCGDVNCVFARGGTYVQTEGDYPDNVVVSLTFTSGALGILHGSLSSAISSYGGRVDCTEGGLAFPIIWGEDAGITVKRFEGEPEFISANGLVDEDPVRRELREFVESIREQRPPAITGHDGRAAIEIATAAYKSIATGAPVALPL